MLYDHLERVGNGTGLDFRPRTKIRKPETLAPLSTTPDLAVAARFSASHHGFLFLMTTTSFMQRGAALRGLEAAQARSQRAFLFLAYNAIHSIITLPKTMTPQADEAYGQLVAGLDAGDYTDVRQNAAGALLSVDRSLESVFAALGDRADETLFVFASDNGGLAGFGGSNWPLRGEKLTLFEGGVRVPAFLWAGSKLTRRTAGTTYSGLVHVSDITPTLLGAAFGDVAWDGYGRDLHRVLLEGAGPEREDLLYGASASAEDSQAAAALVAVAPGSDSQASAGSSSL